MLRISRRLPRLARALPASALLASLGAAGAIALVPTGAHAQSASTAPRARDDVSRDDRGFSFYDRGPYRTTVPRPDALLGYGIGERNTQYDAQQRALLAIADAAKDRVRVETTTTTAEGRQMRLFIVSAPENIARLDEIRANLDRLADPRGASAADLDALAAKTPAVVWISESVHGNESPGFESGMQLLYQLAASDEPATLAALRNTILVLNPSSNPDGHERFTVWYHSMAMSDPDNASYEHDEPWSIQGRFNHYRFDMNRDVIASTQREVQGIMRGMLRWHPMVAVDQHGQVNTYYFPPAARPVNEHIRDESRKWLDVIGRGNAAAFDKHGWMYFVRSEFDLYYPGYWDTWPSLTGATGMTYETDGGGWKGLLWRREDGSLLSMRDGVAKHWVSAMATIETTAARATERVRDYLRFRQGAIADGASGPMKRVVLLPGNDPVRAAQLAAALIRSGVEVRRTNGAFTAPRAHAYYDDAISSRRFDGGAYVVDLAQPLGKVARAILEPVPTLDPVFAKTQRDRFLRNSRRGDRGREGYEFYDITAWSLPVAFGVDAYWTEDAAPVQGELLAIPAENAARVAGEALPVAIPSGITGGARARSAYLFKGDRDGAARLAWHLMAEGYRVGVATETVEAGNARWPRGSYVVRVTRNDSTLHGRLDALARESGVEVSAVNSAFTDTLQFGIGGGEIVDLKTPKLAVIGDEGIDQTAYGALWWSLEHRYGAPFTHLNWDAASGDLSRFTTIIIPSGSAGAIAGRLGKDGAEHLKDWVQRGGVLVTMGGATSWATREDVGLSTARRVGADEKDAKDVKSAKDDKDAKADTTKGTKKPAAKEVVERAHGEETAESLIPVVSPNANPNAPANVPGSHFDVQLDRTHWLTYGYDRPRLTVMFSGPNFYKLSKAGANVATFPTTGPLFRAGFAWPDNTERLLRGTALVIDERLGGGHVVLFANDPMFRGWWRAMDRMVLNAVVLGPSL